MPEFDPPPRKRRNLNEPREAHERIRDAGEEVGQDLQHHPARVTRAFALPGNPFAEEPCQVCQAKPEVIAGREVAGVPKPFTRNGDICTEIVGMD